MEIADELTEADFRDGHARIPIQAAERERLPAEHDARGLELIDRYADTLNADAIDGLHHQADGPSPRPARRARKKKGRKRP